MFITTMTQTMFVAWYNVKLVSCSRHQLMPLQLLQLTANQTVKNLVESSTLGTAH